MWSSSFLALLGLFSIAVFGMCEYEGVGMGGHRDTERDRDKDLGQDKK